MDSMKYKIFTWLDNPETFEIYAVREPEYTVDELGNYNYTGLGPMCRIISGSGVFRGEMAYQNYNTLQVLMTNGVPGVLFHPIWGEISAFLTELTMKSGSREDYVEYTFKFREADENGMIPIMPENKES